MSGFVPDSEPKKPPADMIVPIGQHSIAHVTFTNTYVNRSDAQGYAHVVYSIRLYQSGYIQDGAYIPPVEIKLEPEPGISAFSGLKYFIKMISPYLENNPDG